MDIFNGKKIHMIGIKGVGMTALAELLFVYGAKITGSDIEEEFHTDAVLKRLNIPLSNFDPPQIRPDLDIIIYSSAYSQTHPERLQAEKLGIPQFSYAEILSEIFNSKKGIMVAGSHGKTTVTALLGHIMTAAGLDPTVIVGGTVIGWDSNTRVGKSDWMLIEGDEYQEKFLKFKPDYLLITNIDYDHPDTFPDRNSYRNVFEKLVSQTSKKVFYSQNINSETNGFNSPHLIGEHNKTNLNLVLAISREIEIDEEKIKTGLSEFQGIRRRMEIYCRRQNSIIMDDYAHHPTEISATLSAIKNHWPEHKIIAVFQPHTFSRTNALMEEFARAFTNADTVYLAPTYSSTRESTENRNEVDKRLYENIKKFKQSCIQGIPTPEKIFEDTNKKIVVTMGAGDIWHFARKMALFN